MDLATFVAGTIKYELDSIEGLENKIRAAMKAAKHHYMVTDENDRFKGAMAAVLLQYEESAPERKRLLAELRNIQRMNGMLQAAQSGICIDAVATLESMEEVPGGAIGIMEMWRQA